MPEGLSPHDHDPFSAPLHNGLFDTEVRGRNERLLGIEGHDDIIVRKDEIKTDLLPPQLEELEARREVYQTNPDDEEARKEYHRSLDIVYKTYEAAQYRKYLTRLKEKFDIKNSGYAPVVAEGSNANTVNQYIVTNHIRGLSAETDLADIPEQAVLDLTKKLLQHFKDVYQNGGQINNDLGIDQFMYDLDSGAMVLVDHEPDRQQTMKPKAYFIKDICKQRLLGGLAELERSKGHTYPELRAEIEAAFN